MNCHRYTKVLGLIISFLFLIALPSKAQAEFSGTGTGVDVDPYVIMTCTQLQEIQDDPTAYYVLGQDIDCSMSSTWNSGSGFNPIGGGSDFWGVLDGSNFTINDLYINRPGENSVGLFRTVEGGVVESLNFDGADITGGDKVGVVSGDAEEGEFYDIHITNSTVLAEGKDEVGGLLGYGVETIIEECSFNGSVTGGNRVGGLVGYEEVSMDMSDSYNLGTVNGYIRVGGLIGSVEGTLSIVDSYNKGSIVSSPVEEMYASYEGVGGLVGAAWQPTILRSYNEGDISTSSGELYVGGILGGGGLVNIQQSYNTGNISAFAIAPGNFNGVGGLLGSGINVTILNSYNRGNIDLDISEDYSEVPPIGGILGFAFVSSIKNSYNQGVLTLESDTENQACLGGLAGELYFEDWLLASIISDTGNTFLAKSEGYLFELVNNFNIGDIFGRSNSIVGGLIGSVGYIYDNFDDEFILSNNWWSNNITKGIGRVRDGEAEGDEEVDNEVEGAFEKESIVEGFKTYSHKVYNTDPDWDFDTVWDNVYEGKGYPVLGFHNILAPGKPIANVVPGTYSSVFELSLSAGSYTVRYTTDGSLPTCVNGLLYTSPININSSMVVKAVACDSYGLASVLGEYVYTISPFFVSTNPVLRSSFVSYSSYLDIEEVTEENVVEDVVEDSFVDEVFNNTDIDTNKVSDSHVDTKEFYWWWIIVFVVGLFIICIAYKRVTSSKKYV